MTPLRWGILGTGNIARQFVGDLMGGVGEAGEVGEVGEAGGERHDVVAVGSRTPAAAEQFAQLFHVPVRHASYEALLADPRVEAVYLSLPNTLHAAWATAALRAGKHVLCEKPLAMSVAEATRMFDEAARAQRLLVEAFMYRSHPQTLTLMDHLARGVIGRVRLIRASFSYFTTKIQGNIRFDPMLGGGALMDVGCYTINAARLIAGCEPDEVHGSLARHESGVDDQFVGCLRFPNGIVANLSAGMRCQTDNSLLIGGEAGYLRVPVPWKPPREGGHFLIESMSPPKMDQQAATRYDTTGVTHPPPLGRIDVKAPRPLFRYEADDFARAVRGEAPPRVTREDSLGNMRVLEAMRG